MKIVFSKMHGLGNDFMIIDAVRQNFQVRNELVKRWADRHTGVGFDQLLVIAPTQSKGADFYYRIFNADGSEVAQCGNGARCIAKFLQQENLSSKNPIVVETLAGLLELRLENNGLVTVNMGIPEFEPEKIPFISPQKKLTYSLALQNQQIEFCALSLGNPHCVMMVDDVQQAPVMELGPVLSKHAFFPQETNVGFMQVINDHEIRLRVYERGAEETLACGSGACAAMVAGRMLGLLTDEVNVMQPGGELKVRWQGNDSAVYLTGPATFVYKGEITSRDQA